MKYAAYRLNAARTKTSVLRGVRSSGESHARLGREIGAGVWNHIRSLSARTGGAVRSVLAAAPAAVALARKIYACLYSRGVNRIAQPVHGGAPKMGGSRENADNLGRFPPLLLQPMRPAPRAHEGGVM